jgi:hypothetical protein
VLARRVLLSENSCVLAVGLPVNGGDAIGARRELALVTNAVVAICVVLVPNVAVGATGRPVKVGLARGASVSTLSYTTRLVGGNSESDAQLTPYAVSFGRRTENPPPAPYKSISSWIRTRLSNSAFQSDALTLVLGRTTVRCERGVLRRISSVVDGSTGPPYVSVVAVVLL